MSRVYAIWITKISLNINLCKIIVYCRKYNYVNEYNHLEFIKNEYNTLKIIKPKCWIIVVKWKQLYFQLDLRSIQLLVFH